MQDRRHVHETRQDDTILRVRDLKVSFRSYGGLVQAVRGISFDLKRGETVAVVGESGSGKSVSIKTIMGILPSNAIIESGEIMYDGKDLTKVSEDDFHEIRGKRIGLIFQDPLSALNPIMKIGKQITEALVLAQKMNPKEARGQALELMNAVGISDAERRFDQYPFQFSGGMRQRIVIAIALAGDPEILICDEPTTALDVTVQARILELINSIKKSRNLSVIFITHDLGVVANMADRVNVMYAGKIVETGTSEEIFFDPAHPYTWALLSSMPDLETKERLLAIPGTPPNMIFPPKGDAFAPRNKNALKIDLEMEPPFFKLSETHYAATWLLHPKAPKVELPEVLKARIARMKGGGELHA
jgi:oligopeptide transport system ATP-binding protein